MSDEADFPDIRTFKDQEIGLARELLDCLVELRTWSDSDRATPSDIYNRTDALISRARDILQEGGANG